MDSGFMKTLVHASALTLSVDLTKDLISKPPFLSSLKSGFHKAVTCGVIVSRAWLVRSMCSVRGITWSFQGSANGGRLAGKSIPEVDSLHFPVFCEGKIREKESLSSLLFGKCWVRQK